MEPTRDYLKKLILDGPLLIGILALLLLRAGTVQALASACGQWSIIKSPSPGTYDNSLNAVASVSTNDVWAVGYASNSMSGPYNGIIEHWNGQTWRQVPSPHPPNTIIYLVGVSAISATDIWALGQIDTGQGSV